MTVMKKPPHRIEYDTSIDYLQHANDYWLETAGGCKGFIVDFWNTTQPVYNLNDTIYEEYIFVNAVYDIITNHDKSNPYQESKYRYKMYDNDDHISATKTIIYPGFSTSNPNNYYYKSLYRSMINLLDIIIGNITTLS